MSDDDKDSGTIKFKKKKKKKKLVHGVTDELDDIIDYTLLLDSAYQGVVREVLRIMSSNPVPGRFHFSFSFDTTHPDVEVPNHVRDQHPAIITIVLNQQYDNLIVSDLSFGVTVYFNTLPVRLVVPYASLTGFRDEHADFSIGFRNMNQSITSQGEQGIIEKEEPAEEEITADIISLDDFRNKD